MSFYKMLILLILLLSSKSAWGKQSLTPDQALTELLEGNKRFALGKNQCIKWNQEMRAKRSSPQSPFAIILGCSDSRASPEIIFDQGLGELFIIRNAGNVVSNIEKESIEYGVSVLHSPLIVVLGHQECGAVQTVLKESLENSGIPAIYSLIEKGISQCKQKNGNALVNAIYCNVRQSIEMLKSSPVLTSFLKQKKLKIVGGYYDFITGKVLIIQQSPPHQKESFVGLQEMELLID